MYNNPDHRVPIVTNSRYTGHGFTEEGNISDINSDNTMQTRPVFQYDDMNDESYRFTTASGENDLLLSHSDANLQYYYPSNASVNFNKYSQQHRTGLGFQVPYECINTSQNADSNGSSKITTEISSGFSSFIGFFTKFSKEASSKSVDVFTTILSIAKSFFLNVIGIALGVFLSMLFFTIISFLLYNGKNIKDFKNEPKKKSPPPTPPPKTQIKQQDPPPKPEVTFEPVHFKDILGIDEAKEDVQEIVKFIKQPFLYKKVGAKVPKGILLVGPPGTGKTMLAKAVATETGIPFIYTSGPEFVEIYVGQGAQRIRALFQKARKIAPCIIFIDEIDAVGSKRATGSLSGQNREHDQTLNQLLVEMDGFNVSTGITILAATNRLSALDRALLRPGRFDRVVHIPLPSIQGREEILQHYLKDVNYNKESINVKELSKITPGYSGADLKNLVNEAALITVKQDRLMVELADLYEARDKIIMGNKRKLLMPDIERKMTAYHEAGHALVAYYLYPNTDPIHKATIITRGTALGFVEQLPNDDYDKSSYKLIEMKSRLAVCMAGRLAEKLVFGSDNVTSGASSDIIVATDLAYKMITQYGMSNKLASLNFHNLNNLNNKLSTDLNVKIENEIIELIREAEHIAESILRRKRSQLELLASELLKYETLTGDQITTLLKTNKSLNLPINGLPEESSDLEKDAKANAKTDSSSETNADEGVNAKTETNTDNTPTNSETNSNTEGDNDTHNDVDNNDVNDSDNNDDNVSDKNDDNDTNNDTDNTSPDNNNSEMDTDDTKNDNDDVNDSEDAPNDDDNS
ncbi:metalloprotease/cell division cycle protein (FtsH) [Theileria annulata]|uniref:Metalloprotease/cell division cycle protein (FtsH homologue), putative n=1 Tax=Theileria annulata TaxID=5874 RepID=Q4UIW8_THEAN|nr:metalloprotease/cell division cycle protein (FtsH) [Theileria annulata]CAI72971.1 metalloprotease/cell division cycle protein (FtsH homologue), putative [Theileria annulata]|eukprot:XP_953649.1 metalloprotease/cell division cycle protein (FtsH homologue), putative [Theileria annulata]